MTTMNPARTDDTPTVHRTPLAQRAAWLFAALIRAELTEDEMADVLSANARETDPGVCHTRDFIDSNVTMAAALDAVGVEASVHRDDASAKAYTTLWNEAWELAKASGFATSAPAGPVAPLVEALETVAKIGEAGVIARHESGKRTWHALDEVASISRAAIAKASGAEDALRNALRWALEQIEDSLDPDHQAALAEARKALGE